MFVQFKNSEPLNQYELAINEINQISNARISYNKELALFALDRATSLQDLKLYFNALLKDDSMLSFFKETSLADIKKILATGARDDMAVYQNIQKIISGKPYDQEMIDQLHFELMKEYNLRQKTLSTKMLNKTVKNTFIENTFLREALNSLEPLISRVESDFTRSHHVFPAPLLQRLPGGFKKPHILQKYSVLRQDCIGWLEAEKQKKTNSNPDLRDCETIIDIINKKIEAYKILEKQSPDNLWLTYRTSFAEYHELLELCYNRLALYEEEQALAEQARYIAQLQLVAAQNQSQSNPSVANNQSADPASFLPASTLLEASGERKSEDETVNIFAQKTNAWKKEVEQYKQEKQKAVEEKQRTNRLYVEQQRMFKENCASNKKEADYQTASTLLQHLSSQNLDLIESMFSKPTPHCTLRYATVKSLFGQRENGQLSGTITSAGGSHRKICIENAQHTTGFFDECYFANETKSDTVITGGTFEPHQSGSGSAMMPRVAVKLVCSTLERAGINAENVQRFKKQAEQQKKAANSKNSPS